MTIPEIPVLGDAGGDMWRVFAGACSSHSHRSAYRLHPHDAKEATYGEVGARVRRLCARLRDAEELSGAAVATNGQAVHSALLPNSWQHMELFYAAAGLRVMMNPLNHRLAAAELQEIIGESSACVLYAATSLAALVDKIDFSRTAVRLLVWIELDAVDAAAARRAEEALMVEGVTSRSYMALTWPGAASGEEAFEPLGGHESVSSLGLQLFFTSGTTGKPKGVVHTHDMVYNHSLMSIEALRLDKDGVEQHCWGHFGPMFHVGDVAFIWITAIIGGRHAFHQQQRQVAEVLSVMHRDGVTITKLVPTMLSNITTGSYISDATAGSGFSSLRWILTGGAPLAPELRHEVSAQLGCFVVQGYGMTEATCHISFSWDPSSTGMEVIPRLETKILGDDDSLQPVGQVGEVVVRGPNVHSAYLGRPRDAASGFLPDGFFRTGDLGYKNEAGLLFISGRKKDVIIVGGENVFASEVERVVESHPGVLKSGVVGKPDATFGELVVVAVTLADPAAPFNPRQLMSFCRKQLATYKCPVQVYVLPELPMTPSLKVIKPKLKAEIMARDAETAQAKLIAHQGPTPALQQVKSKSAAPCQHGMQSGNIVRAASQDIDMLNSMVPSFKGVPQRPVAAAQRRAPPSVHIKIQDIIEELLGERLDPGVDLLEAGLDSVLSLQLVATLEETFGAELPGGLLFEHPTVTAIANYLQATGVVAAAGTAAPGPAFPASVRSVLSAPAPAPSSFGQHSSLQVLQDLVEELTGESIQADADLLEAGLDSVLALQLIGSINEAFNIELPGGLLYEYPSLQSIVGYLSVHQLGSMPGLSDRTSGEPDGLSDTLVSVAEAVKSRVGVAGVSSQADHQRIDIVVSTSANDELPQEPGDTVTLPTHPPTNSISQHNPLVLLANLVGLLVRPCLLAAGFVPFLLICHYIHIHVNAYAVVAAMPFVMTACVAVAMHLVILVKWVLLGRVRPGRYRINSWFYVRWLVVHNLFRSMAVWYGPFRETFVLRWFFRLAGAKIGEGVAINTMWITDPDLVSVGAWSVLARDVNLQPSYITNGWLVLSPVAVGEDCALLHGSSVICGGSMPAKAVLEPLQSASHSSATTIMPGAEVPAEVKANRSSRRGLVATLAVLLFIGYLTAFAFLAGASVVVAAFLASGAPVPTETSIILGNPDYSDALLYYLLALPPVIYFVIPWAYFALAALAKLIIVGEFAEGGKPSSQPAGREVRRFLLARIQDNVLFHMCLRQSVMSATTNLQYRAMGSDIGKRVVMCAPYCIEYELLKAEDDAMLMGETAVLGADALRQERCTVRRHGALANSVVLSPGCEVGAGALLGDFTVGPAQQQLTPNLIWSGKPKPWAVSRTAGQWDIPKGYTVSQLFLCTLQLLMGPLTILPGYIAVRYLQLAITMGTAGFSVNMRQGILLLAAPVYIFAIFTCKALVVLLTKWLLAGSYRSSPARVSKTSYRWVAWIALEALILDAEDVVLMDLRGTALLVWWYRALGCKVGRNVTIMAAPLGAEFDLKTIGDNVALNFNCRLFGHSIEGHALNFGPCSVASNVTVGVRSILELSASVAEGTVVAHHTAVHAAKTATANKPAARTAAAGKPSNRAVNQSGPAVSKDLHTPAASAVVPKPQPPAAPTPAAIAAVPSIKSHVVSAGPSHLPASTPSTAVVSSSSSISKPPAPVPEQQPGKVSLSVLQQEFFSIADLEEGAKARLDRRYWDYYSGGAEGEDTLRDNSAAFQRITIMPRCLVDVSHVDMRRRFLGKTLPFPIIVAPSAMHRLADSESGENATARAAAHTGAAMVLSTASSTSMEEVAAVHGGRNGLLMFQLYCMRNRDVSLHLIRRAEAAGYKALVVTVDAPRLGRRERDMRNRMAGHKFPKEVQLPNLELLSHGKCMTTACRLHAMDSQHDDGLTWEGIQWIRSVTSLPVLVKGVLRADDAVKAVKVGCAGIVISNHGGRQLNFSPATITVTKEICDAVKGKIPVLMDGGVRRGTDVFKALALGATAVLVGRPALFGLAVGGYDGVVHALDLLKQELELTMALSGCPSLDSITPDMIRQQGGSHSG